MADQNTGQETKPLYEKTLRDPWVHRSSRMQCRSCMWYVPKINDDGQRIIGRCRKHAPTMGGYPAVFESDWCGDHKLDENK